jgi:[ribosomal protein S5]-alanine N-acetyltransferase
MLLALRSRGHASKLLHRAPRLHPVWPNRHGAVARKADHVESTLAQASYRRSMIVTARLRGTPLEESDLSLLVALHRDEKILSAFGAERQTPEETRAFLALKLAHWHEHGFGIWMFRDAEGTFVGRCGIHRWHGEVELGYIVRSEYWHRGLATEMAAAVAEHSVTTLGLRQLVGFTRATNTASRRVLERVGFVYERDFIDDDDLNVLYRLTVT